MNTTPPLPGFAPDLPAAADVAPPPAGPATVAGLFAEVVFDRPLDTAYSYAVPESLREAIAAGKRVEAPFGRGDTATVGSGRSGTRDGAWGRRRPSGTMAAGAGPRERGEGGGRKGTAPGRPTRPRSPKRSP